MASLSPLQRRVLERLRAIGPEGVPTSALDDSALAARVAPALGLSSQELLEPLRVLKDRGLFHTVPKTAYGRVSSISDSGIRMLERLEAEDAAAEAKSAVGPPIIFISCGQRNEEKIIGQTLARIVNEETTARGFFAENQNSLGALTSEILTPLSECIGLVAVMHHRGNVKLGDLEPFERGSVWVEQEIAMAALLKQIFKHDIGILLYTNVEIALEGIRQQVLIHPIHFDGLDDIAADFRARLRSDFAKFVKPRVYLTARPLEACEAADNQKGTHVAFKTDLVVHNETNERHETLRLHLALPPGWGPIRFPTHKVDCDPETTPEPNAPVDASRFSLLLKGPFEAGTVAPFNDVAFAAQVKAAAAPRVLWRIDHGPHSTPSKGSDFAVLSERWP
jgi:hypothetical protein